MTTSSHRRCASGAANFNPNAVATAARAGLRRPGSHRPPRGRAGAVRSGPGRRPRPRPRPAPGTGACVPHRVECRSMLAAAPRARPDAGGIEPRQQPARRTASGVMQGEYVRPVGPPVRSRSCRPSRSRISRKGERARHERRAHALELRCRHEAVRYQRSVLRLIAPCRVRTRTAPAATGPAARHGLRPSRRHVPQRRDRFRSRRFDPEGHSLRYHGFP